MTTPRRRRNRPQLPLVVPPRPAAPHNRAPLGPDTVRAAYGAHKSHEHAGRLGPGWECRTCARYLTGIARAAEATQQTAP